MVGFDKPHVAHDMMLRFMNVNFSSIAGGTARIHSSIGSDAKPIFVEEQHATPGTPASAKSPQQDKAMWEGPL